jgi:hypothetical protein
MIIWSKEMFDAAEAAETRRELAIFGERGLHAGAVRAVRVRVPNR